MNDWGLAKLGDLLSVSSGEGLPQYKMIFGNIPVYGGNGINGHHNKFLYKEQRIIVGRVGEHCGNVHLTKPKSWVTDNALVVSFKKEENDLLFWFYFLTFLNLKEFSFRGAQPVITGATIDKISTKVTCNYSEQRKISRILSTIDAVIEKTQAAIDKYKAIKQGMLHDLFTRGIDPATNKLRPAYKDAPHLYKESKLGWIPKEWVVELLENLTTKIGSGITPTGGSEVYQSTGVLFLRSQNVLIGYLSIQDAAFISNDIDEMMQASRVLPFDVLLNITGASIGRCAYFPKELKSANVNQHVCIIRFINPLRDLSVFASEFMNSYFGQSQILRLNAGGNREGLNFKQIKSFSFPVIDRIEIKMISKKFEAISNKIQIEQIYLYKMQQIKAGLMADLLSGKKEVRIEEDLLD